MKAVVRRKYGGPEVLNIEEVEIPSIQDNEVLVKVMATSINPLDWHIMRGSPFLVRLREGLFRPKSPFLGADLAGVVEKVGKDVTDFQPGDRVYGELDPYKKSWSYAEYTSVPEKAIVKIEENCSFEEAAAMPVAALTALQGLMRDGDLQTGQEILINGCAGGVGTYAVQIARHYGAKITGVCSTRNIEQSKELGAHEVVDYTQNDIHSKGQKFDLVFDGVGNLSFSDYKKLLKPGGTAVVVGFQSMRQVMAATIFKKSGRSGGVKIGMLQARANQEDFRLLMQLYREGRIRSVIDHTYPLKEIRDAIEYVETGHAKAKVVVTMT